MATPHIELVSTVFEYSTVCEDPSYTVIVGFESPKPPVPTAISVSPSLSTSPTAIP